MNDIDYYRAELRYRREQMRRDREPLRAWRRARAVISARKQDH